MELKNLKGILNDKNELIYIAADINDITHYTEDIRNINSEYSVVFSEATKYNSFANGNMKYLVETGVWKEIPIKELEVLFYQHIWLKFSFQTKN